MGGPGTPSLRFNCCVLAACLIGLTTGCQNDPPTSSDTTARSQDDAETASVTPTTRSAVAVSSKFVDDQGYEYRVRVTGLHIAPTVFGMTAPPGKVMLGVGLEIQS